MSKSNKAATAQVAPAATEEVAVVLTVQQKMSATLAKHRAGYVRTKTAAGGSSMDNGDAIATLLRGKTPEEVCKLAEKLIPNCEATTKYAHLNAGQQRMNAGNLIRNAAKRGEIKAAAITAAAK
jgi:hypothetical protein